MLRPSANCLCVITALTFGITGVSAAYADAQDGLVVRDPHFGSALFYFYQQDHFAALTRLVTAREQQRLEQHVAEAELLQGGLLLSWGQHEEAGGIFERLLASAADRPVRDRAWFYLAKVRYQRGHLESAEDAFESISGTLPPELEAERHNLLARLYMDQGRFDSAVAILNQWQGDDAWSAYARYNLGVALVRRDSLESGASLLNRVGTMRAPDEELRSLRDKANLALGFAYLQAQRESQAKPVLQRVRLHGPFSNKALLGAGWADSADQHYERALASWLELSRRDLLDSAVQESLLAIPYAYARLGATAQAAEHYSYALAAFSTELDRLDTTLGAARSGELLASLLVRDTDFMGSWYWELDELPPGESSRYLYFAIADHRFHEGLKSYRDLLALSGHLEEWREKLDIYRHMVSTREQAYAQRLPYAEARMAELDVPAMERRQYDLRKRLQAADTRRDILEVAPMAEQAQWQRLLDLEHSPAWSSPDSAALREKQRVLKGALLWHMDREYKLRRWQHERAISNLDAELQQLADQLERMDGAIATVGDTVVGFAVRIDRLEPAIDLLQRRLANTMQQYSAYLNGLAVAELQDQRERMASYRAQARFSLATIYDRMAAHTSQAPAR